MWNALTTGTDLEERPFDWRNTRGLAVQDGRWKLIHHGPTVEEGTDELFDLAADPNKTEGLVKPERRCPYKVEENACDPGQPGRAGHGVIVEKVTPNRSAAAEIVKKRHTYRRLILKGRLRVPRAAAARLIGPDRAYHLYRKV